MICFSKNQEEDKNIPLRFAKHNMSSKIVGWLVDVWDGKILELRIKSEINWQVHIFSRIFQEFPYFSKIQKLVYSHGKYQIVAWDFYGHHCNTLSRRHIFALVIGLNSTAFQNPGAEWERGLSWVWHKDKQTNKPSWIYYRMTSKQDQDEECVSFDKQPPEQQA